MDKKSTAYTPQRGDRVRLSFDDDDTWGEGVISAEGPEQSAFRADSDRVDRFILNEKLVLVERAKEGTRVSTAPRRAMREIVERSGFPATARMSRAKAGNPKREGSAAHPRWVLMLQHCDSNATVGEFLTAGGNPTTLKNGVAQGYAKVEE